MNPPATQASYAPPLQERRLSTRVPARLKVWCEGEDFTLLTESLNVSPQGIFLRAGNPPRLGTCFRAIIEELGIVAHVEVRWARSMRDHGRAGMGLQVVAFEQGEGALGDHIERTRVAHEQWLPALETGSIRL